MDEVQGRQSKIGDYIDGKIHQGWKKNKDADQKDAEIRVKRKRLGYPELCHNQLNCFCFVLNLVGVK